MKIWGPLPRSTRLEKSIAELEAELASRRIAPVHIAEDFINTTDTSNFEERLAQLSPALRALIESVARGNVLTFDAILEETVQRRGYPGGWTALRDWARRQPWHEEAVETMKPIMERMANRHVETEEERAAREKDREEFEEFLRSVDRDQRERDSKK